MVSKYYSKARDIEGPYMALEVVRQRMRTLEVLALNAGEAAVDVGCGTGLLTYEMALEVGSEGQVIGIDNSPDMLTHAAERCVDLDQIELKEGGVRDLPVGDRTCDAVACVQVLLFIEDVPGAIT
ncbi:MAG: methyltransferase domain-containing protein, partial [Alphaproteobacteria bacterium]